ncbi:DUF4349 domain-containing protein [Hymenobacter gummosus]|uniref:DUF4349 domain-containing protein n=1 Tax=Hymenobacter gummosus TaxID=1776032 RepID=A0A3S0JGE6_9BACT|nr:DUF4349 domain-containing protein [Hymenobacter gummosus]RTQ52345.1 DUF4349 domain-containing protein [Hymenobacter gummosus]
MKRLLYPALLGLALAGCAQAEKEESTAAETSPLEAAAASEPATAETTPAPLQPHKVAGLTRFPAGRSVIYHGDLRLRVDNFEQTTDRLDQLLAQHEAVLGTAHETRTDGQHQQELTIKVPPRHFLPLVSALGRLGRIEAKDIASSDATADLLAAEQAAASTRAAAAQAGQQVAAQLKPGAKPTAEAKERLSEADAARTKADEAQQRASSLRQQTQWATLNVHLYQPLAEEETAEPLPDYGPRFAAAFLRGGSVFLDVLVGLTNLWPLLALTGLGYWVVRRWRLRQPAS